jgi:hypothetical protein
VKLLLLFLISSNVLAEDIKLVYDKKVYNVPSEAISKSKGIITFFIEKYQTDYPDEISVYEYLYDCKNHTYKDRVSYGTNWQDVNESYASPMTPVRKLADKLC